MQQEHMSKLSVNMTSILASHKENIVHLTTFMIHLWCFCCLFEAWKQVQAESHTT